MSRLLRPALVTGRWLKSIRAPAVVLTLLLAPLAGCSMVRIGYPQLDVIAGWTADEYFDLDPEQKHEFRKRFQRFHEWHRYEQLPDYAVFLVDTKARLQKGFTRDDALWVTDGVRARYRTIVKYAGDDAAAMLMSVTPAQLDNLQQRWEKLNRGFIREYRLESSVEEQRRVTGRRVLSRIRDWVGHLDDAQEQQILAWAGELPLIHGPRHQDRLQRQREFLQLMAQRDDAGRFAARLRHWLLNWEEGRDPGFERLFNEWTQQQADLYAAVYTILLPHQRA
ncbi:MAG: DUF6279 family lipoprotein, partial [Burkholderiales bacterium]